MGLVNDVAPLLPYARRYARALTGSQAGGDAYVRAALEALAEGAALLDPALSPRVALYRVLHAIWETAGARLEAEAEEADDEARRAAARRIVRIPPRSRQAFLLTALEGFSLTEAGAILGVAGQEIDALIRAAQHEIDAELATRVLIIEDEPVIASDIAALVTELGHEVIDLAATRSEAVAAARGGAPGLILADIQLADGSSGIDAAKDILGLFDVPVIFITAFPERLLTGDRPEPTFLIPKPFQPETVKAAIGQALFFHPGLASPLSAPTR